MPIKLRLNDDDRDELTKDVDDLDAVYIDKMKNEGIDPDLLAQFRDLTLAMSQEDKNE